MDAISAVAPRRRREGKVKEGLGISTFGCRLDNIEIAGDLEDAARLEEQLDRLFARPRPRTGAWAEVMTIHKSKGLEYDVVILPALDRLRAVRVVELMRWTRSSRPRRRHRLCADEGCRRRFRSVLPFGSRG